MTDDDIIDAILEREGSEYTDDPADRGGPTKWGITIPDLPIGSTAETVQALTRERAVEIYRQKYILSPGFGTIPLPLRAQVVDCGVLHGVTTAVRMLQEALGVPVDGKLGPLTLRAVDGTPNVGNKLAIVRLKYIARIVQKNPSQAKWLAGWVNRATSFIAV